MYKKIILVAATTVLSLSSLYAGAANAMSEMQYKADKAQYGIDYKTAMNACKSLAGNAKDICVVTAKGNEAVAKADLDARYKGTDKAYINVQYVKADASYKLAREKCDDQTGNPKDVCVKEAKAVHTKAKEDAKLYKVVKTATAASIEDRVTADYKVAIEKCGALAGDAKSACEASAKANFKKQC